MCSVMGSWERMRESCNTERCVRRNYSFTFLDRTAQHSPSTFRPEGALHFFLHPRHKALEKGFASRKPWQFLQVLPLLLRPLLRPPLTDEPEEMRIDGRIPTSLVGVGEDEFDPSSGERGSRARSNNWDK